MIFLFLHLFLITFNNYSRESIFGSNKINMSKINLGSDDVKILKYFLRIIIFRQIKVILIKKR